MDNIRLHTNKFELKLELYIQGKTTGAFPGLLRSGFEPTTLQFEATF